MLHTIKAFWQDIAQQNRDRLATYFHEGALVRWPNTNELFTVREFITANCEYPGRWSGDIEKLLQVGDQIITVTRITNLDSSASFYATSFFTILNDKISEMEEYWGDNGAPPDWRRKLNLGKPIK